MTSSVVSVEQCEHCCYKATRKASLLTNLKSKQDGVNFPCDQCDYKATQKGHSLTHIKPIYGGVKLTVNNVLTRQHRRLIY